MTFKKAKKNQHTILTDLSIASKSYWNYSEAQIIAWKDDLTITQEYFAKHEVYCMELNNRLIGYYAYFKKDTSTIHLDNMFLDPNYIGKGIGKQLMNDFLNRAISMRFNRVDLHSDPNAEGFYLRFGFKKIGQIPTSISGRFLPVMTKRLDHK